MPTELRQLLNRHERVGHLAIPIESGPLIFGRCRIKAGSACLKVPPKTPCLKHRLQKPSSRRPHGAFAPEKSSEIAADAAEKSSEADRREKSCLGRTDVGV